VPKADIGHAVDPLRSTTRFRLEQEIARLHRGEGLP
jgi:hypothetical protein